uniref:CFAP97 domain containing 2 n=1 Tax=Oncorhynchus kisutch TaxID=8019 RepID=A0A8C7CAT3_ONCKI
MQHLLYQPLLLNGNKYLQQKWDKASYEMHLRKVSESCFDFQEQSMSKIQRENNMLLEKISHIMRTTGRIDNRNDYENKRYGELLRITKDNQLILLRLTQCQPHYSIKDWHEDWLKTIKLMESIARYPRRAIGRSYSKHNTLLKSASLTMAKGECEEEPDQQEEEVGL